MVLLPAVKLWLEANVKIKSPVDAVYPTPVGVNLVPLQESTAIASADALTKACVWSPPVYAAPATAETNLCGYWAPTVANIFAPVPAPPPEPTPTLIVFVVVAVIAKVALWAGSDVLG